MSNRKNLKRTIVVVASCVVLAAAGSLFYLIQSHYRNYAQETAKPLEQALKKAGAIKMCESGDAGRGPDNTAPWYYAIYELDGDRQKSADTLMTAVHTGGYQLTSQPSDSNSVNYIDNVTKQSPYSDLRQGNVGLSVEIFNTNNVYDKGSHTCSIKKTDKSNDGETFTRITLSLPEFKR